MNVSSKTPLSSTNKTVSTIVSTVKKQALPVKSEDHERLTALHAFVSLTPAMPVSIKTPLQITLEDTTKLMDTLQAFNQTLSKEQTNLFTKGPSVTSLMMFSANNAMKGSLSFANRETEILLNMFQNFGPNSDANKEIKK